MSSLLDENLPDSIDDQIPKGTILRSIAIFTAMEVCGSFLTGKSGPSTTSENFRTFCTSKYMPQSYHRIADLLLSIFRNGVVHSYVPKGAAQLSSDEGCRDIHLDFFDSGLCIFVPKLAEDVKNGIRELAKDLRSDMNMQQLYYKVFQDLDAAGKKDYLDFVKRNNITTKRGNFRGDINISL